MNQKIKVEITEWPVMDLIRVCKKCGYQTTDCSQVGCPKCVKTFMKNYEQNTQRRLRQ